MQHSIHCIKVLSVCRGTHLDSLLVAEVGAETVDGDGDLRERRRDVVRCVRVCVRACVCVRVCACV